MTMNIFVQDVCVLSDEDDDVCVLSDEDDDVCVLSDEDEDVLDLNYAHGNELCSCTVPVTFVLPEHAVDDDKQVLESIMDVGEQVHDPIVMDVEQVLDGDDAAGTSNIGGLDSGQTGLPDSNSSDDGAGQDIGENEAEEEDDEAYDEGVDALYEAALMPTDVVPVGAGQDIGENEAEEDDDEAYDEGVDALYEAALMPTDVVPVPHWGEMTTQ